MRYNISVNIGEEYLPFTGRKIAEAGTGSPAYFIKKLFLAQLVEILVVLFYCPR